MEGTKAAMHACIHFIGPLTLHYASSAQEEEEKEEEEEKTLIFPKGYSFPCGRRSRRRRRRRRRLIFL